MTALTKVIQMVPKRLLKIMIRPKPPLFFMKNPRLRKFKAMLSFIQNSQVELAWPRDQLEMGLPRRWERDIQTVSCASVVQCLVNFRLCYF